MRLESVNGKKYILVIVDDYSRFTRVKFLRSKDEAPDFIIKFLKMIQVQLKVLVRRIRTDNGTEFVNQTLLEYYEEVGISHETSVARSPHHNGVIEDRLWQSLVIPKIDPSYDFATERHWKLQPKVDIGIFIGYASTKKAFQIYNRRTRRIVETIHVDFDELMAMAFEQSSSGPALNEMTPTTIIQADSTGSPSSTTVDQDAPSLSKSHTTAETQSSVIPQDVEEDNLDIEVAHIGLNLHQRNTALNLVTQWILQWWRNSNWMRIKKGKSLIHHINVDSSVALTAFADADHTGCQDTRRSTSG
nr:hypothetical protein [Tanacetum cinerariifolium]